MNQLCCCFCHHQAAIVIVSWGLIICYLCNAVKIVCPIINDLFINSWTRLLFIFVVKCLSLFSKCCVLKFIKMEKNEYCVFRKLIDWIFSQNIDNVKSRWLGPNVSIIVVVASHANPFVRDQNQFDFWRSFLCQHRWISYWTFFFY